MLINIKDITVNLITFCQKFNFVSGMGSLSIEVELADMDSYTIGSFKNGKHAGSNGTTGASNHTIIYIGPMDVDGDGQMDEGGKPYVLECTTSGGKSGPMFHTRNWSYLNAYGYYCNWL